MSLVILDRDGVINQDSDHYIKSADEWLPIEGSLEAIARLKQAGYTVAVATNQSGLGRGLFDLASLEAQHAKMRDLLRALGGDVDFIAYCPHLPDAGCDCRKPEPGLLEQISEHFQCSLDGVPFVGDSFKDLEAARAVGAQPVLVKTGKGAQTLEKDLSGVDPVICDNLGAAVDYILRN